MKELKTLNSSGIEIESFQKRYYPLGEQIATLIGFAGKMDLAWRVLKIF